MSKYSSIKNSSIPTSFVSRRKDKLGLKSSTSSDETPSTPQIPEEIEEIDSSSPEQKSLHEANSPTFDHVSDSDNSPISSAKSKNSSSSANLGANDLSEDEEITDQKKTWTPFPFSKTSDDEIISINRPSLQLTEEEPPSKAPTPSILEFDPNKISEILNPRYSGKDSIDSAGRPTKVCELCPGQKQLPHSYAVRQHMKGKIHLASIQRAKKELGTNPYTYKNPQKKPPFQATNTQSLHSQNPEVNYLTSLQGFSNNVTYDNKSGVNNSIAHIQELHSSIQSIHQELLSINKEMKQTQATIAMLTSTNVTVQEHLNMLLETQRMTKEKNDQATSEFLKKNTFSSSSDPTLDSIQDLSMNQMLDHHTAEHSEFKDLQLRTIKVLNPNTDIKLFSKELVLEAISKKGVEVIGCFWKFTPVIPYIPNEFCILTTYDTGALKLLSDAKLLISGRLYQLERISEENFKLFYIKIRTFSQNEARKEFKDQIKKKRISSQSGSGSDSDQKRNSTLKRSSKQYKARNANISPSTPEPSRQKELELELRLKNAEIMRLNNMIYQPTISKTRIPFPMDFSSLRPELNPYTYNLDPRQPTPAHFPQMGPSTSNPTPPPLQ
jgi:hypothetical protein